MEFAVFGRERAPQTGIAEERNGRPCLHQDQAPQAQRASLEPVPGNTESARRRKCPPPRSILAAYRSPKTRTPVAARSRPAASSPRRWSALPLSSNPAGSPDRKMQAASRMLSIPGTRREDRGAARPGTPASLQEKSAGTISVATCPGGLDSGGDRGRCGGAHVVRALQRSNPTGNRAREGFRVARRAARHSAGAR